MEKKEPGREYVPGRGRATLFGGDFDLVGLGFRRRQFGQGDFQNALLEFRPDLFCINLARQPQ
jgi:hypothetical protein